MNNFFSYPISGLRKNSESSHLQNSRAFYNVFYSSTTAEHTENMGIHRRFLHNMLFLDILDWAGEKAMEPPFEVTEARYTALYQVLKPLIISYGRPVYLRPDEWVKRQERFEL